MADVSINTASRANSFRIDGGEIRITPTDSADDYVLANIVGGVTWSPGGRNELPTKDNGKFTGPIAAGDEQPTSFSFQIRRVNDNADTNSIYDLFDAPVANGLIPRATVQFRQPDFEGSANGETITFANVPLDPKHLSFSSGDEEDVIDFQGISYSSKPTIASY